MFFTSIICWVIAKSPKYTSQENSSNLIYSHHRKIKFCNFKDDCIICIYRLNLTGVLQLGLLCIYTLYYEALKTENKLKLTPH